MAQDVELREFIESWIPVNVKDAPHEEFMRHIAEREQAAIKHFADDLTKQAVHYTEDGLVADGLDKWAVPVSSISAQLNQSQDKETK